MVRQVPSGYYCIIINVHVWDGAVYRRFFGKMFAFVLLCTCDSVVSSRLFCYIMHSSLGHRVISHRKIVSDSTVSCSIKKVVPSTQLYFMSSSVISHRKINMIDSTVFCGPSIKLQ